MCLFFVVGHIFRPSLSSREIVTKMWTCLCNGIYQIKMGTTTSCQCVCPASVAAADNAVDCSDAYSELVAATEPQKEDDPVVNANRVSLVPAQSR